MLDYIKNIFKKDIVFTIAFILAVSSCFLNTPKLQYIDFKVLISLFNLMLVVKAFEEIKLLDRLATAILNKCSSSRRVSAVLICLCFFCSMLITNDVALITFVPLTIIISKKTKIQVLDTIIIQTMAANIGSSLTPMGNPQNLFIFSHYNVTPTGFLMSVMLLAVSGAVLLLILNSRLSNNIINVELPIVQTSNKREAVIWIAVFFIVTTSILGIINYKIAFIITLLTAFFLNKKLFNKVDYILLITFVCFFIFVGNISNIKIIDNYMSQHLKSGASIYFSSILLSQFISNVPAAILLSKFCIDWKPLLLGVNIGGLGTLIASLASLISYKLFIKDYSDEGKNYMIKFSIYNFSGLVLLTLINLYFAL